MTITIVLSSILLILTLALIFSKDFRADVLKPGSENEGEFKGLKFKGTVFWVMYAATLFGAVFSGNKEEGNSFFQDCTPVLTPVDANSWVALDIDNVKPVALTYGCADSTVLKDHTTKTMNMDLRMNRALEVVGAKSDYKIGEISKQSLKDLQLSNDFGIYKYIEIKYDLTLNPKFISDRDKDNFYDWSDYSDLPFTVTVNWDSDRGVHSVIQTTENQPDTIIYRNLNKKWNIPLFVDGSYYVVRLRSSDLMKNNEIDEHANFQIIQFSGEIRDMD